MFLYAAFHAETAAQMCNVQFKALVCIMFYISPADK